MPWFQSNSKRAICIDSPFFHRTYAASGCFCGEQQGGVFPVDRSAALYCTERELPLEIARTDQYELSYMML